MSLVQLAANRVVNTLKNPWVAGALCATVVGSIVVRALNDPRPQATDVRQGLYWDPDDTLPSVGPGGAKQAAWATAVLANYDADKDQQLDHGDGAATSGSWGTAEKVVSRLIARYDTNRDATVDRSEATQLGSDFANADGMITADASHRLRDAINRG